MSMSYLGGTGATIAASWTVAANEPTLLGKLGAGTCAVFDTVTAPIQGLFNMSTFDTYEAAVKTVDKLSTMHGGKPYSESMPWYARPQNLKWIGAASVTATVAAVVAGILIARNKKSEE